MYRERHGRFRRRRILEQTLDRRVGGAAQLPGLFTGAFQLCPSVLFAKLEYAHAGTVRAFFYRLGLQHGVHHRPRSLPNGLRPSPVTLTVPLVCRLLVLVLFRHVRRIRRIPGTILYALVQRHPLPILIEDFNHPASHTQLYLFPKQRVGHRALLST